MLTLASIGDVVQISLTDLAAQTGLAKASVRTHLALLEESGWLSALRPDEASARRGSAVAYGLGIPSGMVHSSTPVSIIDTGVAQSLTQGGVIIDTGVAQSLTQGVSIATPPPMGYTRARLNEVDFPSESQQLKSKSTSLVVLAPSIESAAAPLPLPAVAEIELRATTSVSRKTKTNADSPEFDRFWKGYPRKIGKGAARTAWVKHVVVAGVDLELVVSAAEFFGLTRHGQDPKYTPHASTWLSQQRWEDTPDPEYRELNKAEQRTAHNLSLVVAAAERQGTDPMSVLCPDEAEQARLKAETEAWYRGEPLPPRPVAPSAPENGRRGGSPALEAAEWGSGRGRLF